MFKKLKQRIGQEASPSPADKSHSSQSNTDDGKHQAKEEQVVPRNEFEPAAVHNHSLPPDSNSPVISLPDFTKDESAEALTKLSPENVIDDISDSKHLHEASGEISSLLLETQESPNSASSSSIHQDFSPETSELAEASNRRKNLAATVLKYGEEISAKNKRIIDLETKLMARGGNSERVAQLEESLNTSESAIERLNEKIHDQEETIKQLIKSLSELEETQTTDKSIIVDLECKLDERQKEIRRLVDKLQAYELKEASSEETIKSLNSQMEHLKEQVNHSKDNIKFGTRSNSDLTSEVGDNQMSELKVKLSRSHSHSKQLELQLTDKEAQLAALVLENKNMRANLENSKQQAVNELLTVSEEESGLRLELSALVQKHNSLQSQHKSQSRLLSEKQKDMIQLEERLHNSTKVNSREREQIVEKYTKQITELETVNEALKLSLAAETQTGAKLREQLDSLREEALDKQLDDEKQLSDLHEQLSALRGEAWQLERCKKQDTEKFHAELLAKENSCSQLEELLAATRAERDASKESFTRQLAEVNKKLDSLSVSKEELKQLLADVESKLETIEAERDDLYLRNADLSSKLETCKMELKSAISNHKQEKHSMEERLNYNEAERKSFVEKEEALKEKVALLEEHGRLADGAQAVAEEKSAEIARLQDQLVEQDKIIGERTKSIRVHQQTINDLKKTIKRELKGLGEVGSLAPSLGTTRSQDLVDRVRSSPALSELERYDSPIEDNISSPVRPKPQATDESTARNSGAPSQQYRHEVNGFCGHKDINFEYLKNVLFSFLISRDSESMQLVKALAVLLEFTPAEERLLKETVEWKMSWWPSAKKPTKKFRK